MVKYIRDGQMRPLGPPAAPNTFFVARRGATGSTWYRGTYQQNRTSHTRCGMARRGKLALIVIVSGLTQENLHARLSVFLDRTLNTFPWQYIQPQ